MFSAVPRESSVQNQVNTYLSKFSNHCNAPSCSPRSANEADLVSFETPKQPPRRGKYLDAQVCKDCGATVGMSQASKGGFVVVLMNI